MQRSELQLAEKVRQNGNLGGVVVKTEGFTSPLGSQFLMVEDVEGCQGVYPSYTQVLSQMVNAAGYGPCQQVPFEILAPVYSGTVGSEPIKHVPSYSCLPWGS